MKKVFFLILMFILSYNISFASLNQIQETKLKLQTKNIYLSFEKKLSKLDNKTQINKINNLTEKIDNILKKDISNKNKIILNYLKELLNSRKNTLEINSLPNINDIAINKKNLKVKVDGEYQYYSKLDIYKIIQKNDPYAVKYLGLTPEKIGEGPYKSQISGDAFSSVSSSKIASGEMSITDKSYAPSRSWLFSIGEKQKYTYQGQTVYAYNIGQSVFTSFFGNVSYNSEKYNDLKNIIFQNGKVNFEGGLGPIENPIKIGKNPNVDYSKVQPEMTMKGVDAYNWFKNAIEAEGLSNSFEFIYISFNKEYHIKYTNLWNGMKNDIVFIDGEDYIINHQFKNSTDRFNFDANTSIGTVLDYFTNRY